jgi:hypothetical protein
VSEFDSFMVRVEIGGNRKLARFTPEERWCVVAGVWALAAKSPVRGYLLIAENVAVEVDDVAAQAEVKPLTARRTLEKMRKLGMLEHDDELGAEHVHDWHQHQRDPKPSESREAWRERQRRKRDRDRESRAQAVTTSRVTTGAESHPKREEKRSKGNNPPLPPASGGRQRDRDRFDRELAAWVAEELPQLPPRETVGMVRAALGEGLHRREEILAYLARWNSNAAASIEAVA